MFTVGIVIPSIRVGFNIVAFVLHGSSVHAKRTLADFDVQESNYGFPLLVPCFHLYIYII